jgi:hypothetical protein
MKFLSFVASAAAIALTACARTPAAGPAPLQHVMTTFDLMVNAPYAIAAPLFGPEGERAWAGRHWNPEFIYPQPARDEEGAVFTIQHGHMKAVWVNTLMDTPAQHFQYVYVLPDIMVTVIDVRFKVISPDATGVNVVYTRTALTPGGNEHVSAMSADDKTAGKEWEQAISAYLAQQKAAGKP